MVYVVDDCDAVIVVVIVAGEMVEFSEASAFDEVVATGCDDGEDEDENGDEDDDDDAVTLLCSILFIYNPFNANLANTIQKLYMFKSLLLAAVLIYGI